MQCPQGLIHSVKISAAASRALRRAAFTTKDIPAMFTAITGKQPMIAFDLVVAALQQNRLAVNESFSNHAVGPLNNTSKGGPGNTHLYTGFLLG